MEGKSKLLCSFGGDGYHLPGHSVAACVTAYTEGADLFRLVIQASLDGVPILYPHSDLSATTEGQGKINHLSWEELQKLDAGHTFQRGVDYPWRRWLTDGGRPKRHHQLSCLSSLVNVLEGEVTYALQFGGLDPANPAWEKLVHDCLSQLDAVGAKQVILCADQIGHLEALRQVGGGRFPLGLVLNKSEDVGGWIKEMAPEYIFCPWTMFNSMEDSLRRTIVEKCRLIAHLPPNIDGPTASAASEVAYGLESESIMNLAPQILGSRVRFLEEFKGKWINRDHWVAGVSSGYTNLHRAAFRAIDDRGRCEVKVYQDDALIIEVSQGYQYASGAVVSVFSVGGNFSVEVAFRYENSQNATEMVMCALNSTVYPIYHREGEIRHVSVEDEHPAFDAHGLCPYVSIEREEADGNRIMHNQSFSELFNLRQTNFYRHDVGAGDSKDVELRMGRRGRFFTGHYKDEKNPEWVGLGYVENNSMNDRVFFRLSGKHYPKSTAPDPLPFNRFTFKRFCIRQPRL